LTEEKNMSVDDTWTESRCAELLALERLLSDVSMINSGSHVLQRIARCIETAEALRSTDYGSGRSNFMLFLNKEATRAVLASRTARELSNDEIFSIAQPIFGDCMEIGPADVLAFARAVLNTPPKAEIAAAA
jgi:hypothetical protein